jgi:hypothetical protein
MTAVIALASFAFLALAIFIPLGTWVMLYPDPFPSSLMSFDLTKARSPLTLAGTAFFPVALDTSISWLLNFCDFTA